MYGISNDMNLHTFVQKYKYNATQGKLEEIKLTEGKEFIINYFPHYSGKKGSPYFYQFLKHQLLKYRPWNDDPTNAWNNLSDDNEEGIKKCYQDFMNSQWAEEHLNETIRNVVNLANIEPILDEDDQDLPFTPSRPDWQIACEAHLTEDDINISHDWTIDAQLYPDALRLAEGHISEIRNEPITKQIYKQIKLKEFSDGQELAYKIINDHNLHKYVMLYVIKILIESKIYLAN